MFYIILIVLVARNSTIAVFRQTTSTVFSFFFLLAESFMTQSLGALRRCEARPRNQEQLWSTFPLLIYSCIGVRVGQYVAFRTQCGPKVLQHSIDVRQNLKSGMRLRTTVTGVSTCRDTSPLPNSCPRFKGYGACLKGSTPSLDCIWPQSLPLDCP